MEDLKFMAEDIHLLEYSDTEKQDPVKLYFGKSLKNLLLQNRLSGPVLTSDIQLQQILHRYFSSKIILKADDRIFTSLKEV